jgi:hypothetical protein
MSARRPKLILAREKSKRVKESNSRRLRRILRQMLAEKRHGEFAHTVPVKGYRNLLE